MSTVSVAQGFCEGLEKQPLAHEVSNKQSNQEQSSGKQGRCRQAGVLSLKMVLKVHDEVHMCGNDRDCSSLKQTLEQ